MLLMSSVTVAAQSVDPGIDRMVPGSIAAAPQQIKRATRVGGLGAEIDADVNMKVWRLSGRHHCSVIVLLQRRPEGDEAGRNAGAKSIPDLFFPLLFYY